MFNRNRNYPQQLLEENLIRYKQELPAAVGEKLDEIIAKAMLIKQGLPAAVGGKLDKISEMCYKQELPAAVGGKLDKISIEDIRRKGGLILGAVLLHLGVYVSDIIPEVLCRYTLQYVLCVVTTGFDHKPMWSERTGPSNLTICVVPDGKQLRTEDDKSKFNILVTFKFFPYLTYSFVEILGVFHGNLLKKAFMYRKHHNKNPKFIKPVVSRLLVLGVESTGGSLPETVIDYFNKQAKKINKEKKKNEEDDNGINDMEVDEEEIDTCDGRDLTEAQGTVILHVTHQAQRDPNIVSDYLKLIKTSTWLTENLITPFNLALALSLASIDKYQDQILESLKSCLLKSFRHEERAQHSKWLRTTWEDKCNIDDVFKITINNCVSGWDQVSQSLVQLAFSLLESGSGLKGETYPSQRAVGLASLILPLILKKQPHQAPEIIKQLTNFILTVSSPSQYIDILGKVSRSSPLLLMDHLGLIRELLDQLMFLSLPATTSLLQAILPLLKMNMTLKDDIMLILRKMLFSKQVESRQGAVKGFLQFLRHFRVMGALPCSQASISFSSALSQVNVSADVHSTLDGSTNEALCLELLGVLRRCFSQQLQVKSTLYEGFYDVCRSNPKLCVNILELLHQHAKQFVDERPEVANPIRIKNAVAVHGDTVTLVEPLGDLFSSLASCKTFYEEWREKNNNEEDEEDEAIAVLNDICSLFDVLTEKLSTCDLDDLEMDKNADFSSATLPGQKNNLNGQVYIGVFDAILEHVFHHGAQKEEEKMRSLLAIFKTQRKIVDLLKERSGKPGGKKGEGSAAKKGEGSKGRGRPGGNKTTGPSLRSNLSLRTVADMLDVSYGDNEDNESCSEILRENHDIQMYILAVIEQNISSFKAAIQTDREKMLFKLKPIAQILLRDCRNNLAGDDSSNEREVVRLRLSLHILLSLLSIFTKYFKDKLESVLKEVTGTTSCKDKNSLLHSIMKKCKEMLLKILHHEERKPLMKDGVMVLQLMSNVTQAMEADCEQLESCFDWVLILCKEQQVDNPAFAEALVNLTLNLAFQVKATPGTIKGLGKEIHFCLGDIEQDVSVPEAGKYNIVSSETAPAVLGTVQTSLEESLVLLELIINKAKSCILSGTEFDQDACEKQLCTRIGLTIHTVHEIVLTALPLGSVTDQTLRLLTKLFNTLSMYVKFYLDLFRIKSYAQISDKFEKLIQLSGEMLSCQVYPVITYIEGAQRDSGKKGQNTSTARAIKEAKLIPAFIFAIEQYESKLIILSKKSKTNLTQGMKLSTSRDFRIKAPELMEAMEESNKQEESDSEDDVTNIEEGEDEDKNEDDEAGDENDPGSQNRIEKISQEPPAKKSKLKGKKK
ncbi:unnamed protein product, partial [Meganyctiphanes norvegica]